MERNFQFIEHRFKFKLAAKYPLCYTTGHFTLHIMDVTDSGGENLPDGIQEQKEQREGLQIAQFLPNFWLIPRSRREALGLGVSTLAVLFAAACAPNTNTPSSKPTPKPEATPTHTPESAADLFAKQVGQSLIDLHSESNGGWRFESQIQAPNFQTDRDVGAASVGMGFIALAKQYPDDPGWINAINKVATWLLAVSHTDKNGRYWHDYVNDGAEAKATFTSFDDGALGIGDFLWQLYELTGNTTYADAAKQSVTWLLSKAIDPYNGQEGRVYGWLWDITDATSGFQMGMGEGIVGIVHTLATYYERTIQNDPGFANKCKQALDLTLNFLDLAREKMAVELSGTSDITDSNYQNYVRAMPETGIIGQDNDTALNSGYLSGAAGCAFMYLKLYQVFGDKSYLDKANVLFNWLEDSANGPAIVNGDTIAWKRMLDPEGGNDNALATGIEEGAAGIGWVYVQAWRITKNQHYLDIARMAGNWLLSSGVAIISGDTMSWAEDISGGSSLIRPNLDNGAAGIGMFLKDLADATGDPIYLDAARKTLKWLISVAVKLGNDIYWEDNDEGNPFSKDPSWHWGLSGIIAFMLRMLNGITDIPGEQPALQKI